MSRTGRPRRQPDLLHRVCHRGEVCVAQPLVPAVQVASVLVPDVRLDRRNVVAELHRVRHGRRRIPGRLLRALTLRCERAGQRTRVQLRPLVLADLHPRQVGRGQVHQPGAGQLRVEHRRLHVRRLAQGDDQTVGAGGEGRVHVDADQVPQGALGIRHRPRPVVRLLEQLLHRAADVEARQVLQQRVPVWGLARRTVHRMLAQRAGVVLRGAACPQCPARRRGWADAARSSAPGAVTAVDPRGVITRDAYTPSTRASSAGGS